MVDTVYWLSIGGPAAQVSWLCPKGRHLPPFCVHRAVYVDENTVYA